MMKKLLWFFMKLIQVNRDCRTRYVGDAFPLVEVSSFHKGIKIRVKFGRNYCLRFVYSPEFKGSKTRLDWLKRQEMLKAA